jgi:putative membrane protein
VITLALVFAALAALLHAYIFVLESLRWTAPRTRAVFGTTAEEAQTTKELAFNQGFYNLFLAVIAAVGIVMVVTGHRSVGAALIFASAVSMLAAALVLVVSSPEKARPAVGVALL